MLGRDQLYVNFLVNFGIYKISYVWKAGSTERARND